ncbi:MAG TPA: alpha-L-fucosidase [Bryobacteraceae bacterium]|nr:alpha-L-fucosidase [Bryobacteraceae bacterium]
MKLTRRDALKLAAVPLFAQTRAPFQPTWESLKRYRCPEWFRDAKLGFWAHWGPQGGPKQGDWYARNMYIQGTRQNLYHVAHFGHPSKVGYKDVIPLWTAKNWEPETLIRRYKKAGARYFMSLGVHCDNFDCWNSKHHTWNAVNHGPKRDVVGTWRKVARENGLRFGVSEHLAWSWDWFNVNKNSDKTGPLAGVLYDGNDPKYQELYFPPHADDEAHYSYDAPDSWKQEWLRRVTDLIDQNQPDLVYTDGGAFGSVGLEAIAHYYNANMKWHKGNLDGVYTLKYQPPGSHGKFGDYQPGATSLDVERGFVPKIQDEPFQTDTCIGQWFYWEGFDYKTPKYLAQRLVDIVSKNGNMVLSIPQLPDGTIDSREESIVDDFTAWSTIHAPGIFGSRPWKIFGEGPTSVPTGQKSERTMKPFTAEDLRFTTQGEKLYVFCLGVPESDVRIKALGKTAETGQRKIEYVRVLGSDEKVTWTVEDDALRIGVPQHKPSDLTLAFEIS